MRFAKQNPDTPRGKGMSTMDPAVSSGPEVVEVEVERLGVRPSRFQVWTKRALGFVKPTILGALVDLGDLVTSVTLAPLALPVGACVGYFFASILEAPPTWRVLIAGAVGFYWIFPFTSPVPVAAVLAAVVYIFRPDVMERDPVLDRG